jgi:hypothetical protein
MSEDGERNRQLLAFYEKHRISDQLRFYRNRRELFDRATGQALALAATLLGFSSAASALAGADIGWTAVWSALATILPAAASALAGYNAVYAFEQQSKIYADAIRAVHAASRPRPDLDAAQGGRSPEECVAELVKRVEAAFRQEQAQWGQLTTHIATVDETGD